MWASWSQSLTTWVSTVVVPLGSAIGLKHAGGDRAMCLRDRHNSTLRWKHARSPEATNACFERLADEDHVVSGGVTLALTMLVTVLTPSDLKK